MYYAGRALAARHDRRLIQLPGGRRVRRGSHGPPNIGYEMPMMRSGPQPFPVQGHTQSTIIYPQAAYPAVLPSAYPPQWGTYPPHGIQYQMCSFPPPAYPGQILNPDIRGSSRTHHPTTRAHSSRPRNDGLGEENWERRAEGVRWRQRIARMFGMQVGRASTIASSSSSSPLGFRNSRDLGVQTGSRRPSASSATRPHTQPRTSLQIDRRHGSQTRPHQPVNEDSSSSRTDAATVHSDDFDAPGPFQKDHLKAVKRRSTEEHPLRSESSLVSSISQSDRPRSLPTQSSITLPRGHPKSERYVFVHDFIWCQRIVASW
ncbi:hypothetical protein CC79DRAFT_73274 [Sarocladium strictum]